MKLRLVLLTHPPTFGTTSMPRFAGMILRGMADRGHPVEAWTSPQRIGRLPVKSAVVRKWLGYVDQFLLYPRALRQLVNKQSPDTVFVVTDQALGMWVPCLAHRPHVIHCHDFLALRSALGEFPENPTGWTGRQYQQLIRKGLSNGNVFISVSKKTREDLHRFLPSKPKISEVVYNGLNYPFRPMAVAERVSILKKSVAEVPEQGYVLHISGLQWYKNPKGVLEIYRVYAATATNPVPLWMVGAPPSQELFNLAASIPSGGKVQFLSSFSDEQINAAYSHARALLFPSLEEGFGWPIIEAMAAMCPVITTNSPPMNEIASAGARLMPRMPADSAGQKVWTEMGGKTVNEVVCMNGPERDEILNRGKLNASRFDAKTALDEYEKIYLRALAN